MKTDMQFVSYLAHFFVKWKMFPTEVADKIKTHILCSVRHPPDPTENRAVYELMWENQVEPDRPHMTV